MRTKAYRKDTMADLNLAINNCIESVKKRAMQQKMKKKLLASVIIHIMSMFK